MKNVLFFTFIGIFIATAGITLLGIAGQLEIDDIYLGKLFYLLIAEVIGSVVGLFKATDFFPKNDPQQTGGRLSKVNVVMLPKESFPVDKEPYECKIAVYNPDTDEEHEIDLSPIRTNGYLTTFLDIVNENELIKVGLKNATREAWESEYFAPTLAKAEMVKL